LTVLSDKVSQLMRHLHITAQPSAPLDRIAQHGLS
jgi:hypothetical protein